jgi:TRAP-type mannitol/chloroaromatic compound transport system substrate-binding protein
MADIKRRGFIKGAGLAGLGAATLAAPAIAQSAPELKWRMTSSFPKSLDTLYGGAEIFAKAVSDMTDGKFQISVFAAGEIVPGLQAMDAVSAGSVEMCPPAPYYYFGKDETWAFGTCLPFGFNARGQNAWWIEGGGEKLMNEFYARSNIYGIPAGNTGAQMGGWFNREIKSAADLKGLKMRIGGFAGRVMSKLGLVPQQIAGGEIYQALEKGTIDAAEWVGPYDDEKLGFQKVAKFYYYPGWWEGGPQLQVFTNVAKWNELPKAYKAILLAAGGFTNDRMMAAYDARNPPALKRLLAGGTQLKGFTPDTMEACYKAAQELFAETSAKNETFKKVYESYRAFQKDQYLWWQVTELSFDAFMSSAVNQ